MSENSFNFTQALIFLGILFLSPQIQAQKPENKTSTIKAVEKITNKKNETQTEQTKPAEKEETKTNQTDKQTEETEKQTNTEQTKPAEKEETKTNQTDKQTEETEKQTNTEQTKPAEKEETKTNQTDKQTEETEKQTNTEQTKPAEKEETKTNQTDKQTEETEKQTNTEQTKPAEKEETKTNQTDKQTEETEKQTNTEQTKPAEKEETKTNQTDKQTEETEKQTNTEQTKPAEKEGISQGVQKKEDDIKKKTIPEYEAQQIQTDAASSNESKENQNPKTQEKEEKVDGPSVVVSRRSVSKRSPLRSSVPIDVIDSSDLMTFGNTVDLTDQLNTLVPSYMASPAVLKNSAFVRPTTLRGMASDQTLVLVNGKRRHRSALVQEFGPLTNRGSQGVDIAMIPTIALKNVEILRGGASAQYGSDALAGVINLNLKDAPDKGSVQATYGRFYEGENSWRVGANLGLSFLDNHGFANLSFDTNEAEGHSRGEQDRRVSQLTNRNLGKDRRALYFPQRQRSSRRYRGKSRVGNDAVFDDAPLVNSWGRPQTTGTRFMLNSELQLNPSTDIYLFGNYAVTDGRIRLLYRDPEDPAFTGDSRLADNLGEIQKTGFTPFLDGQQEDMSLVFGVKGEILEHTIYDFSANFGSNTLDQKLKNSLNPDAQHYYGAAQRDFNLGSYKQQEQNFNADFSTILNKETNTNVSYGLEYREELFGQYEGSLSSSVGDGPSGMTGISQESEHTRKNYSAYVDLEHEFKKSISLQYSFRYDNFSDFGDVTNNKVAGLIKLTPNFSMRGSLSTNFRAPTLGQTHLTSTIIGPPNLEISDYSDDQIRTINFPADSTEVREFGGTPLKEESSTDVSLGFMSKMGNHSLFVDGYHVKVKDRIYKKIIDQGVYEDSLSFYANALDLRHRGVDVVWATDLSKHFSLANVFLNMAYNYNTVEVLDNKFVGGQRVLTYEQIEDMENNYPRHNFVFTANARIKKWGIMTRARYIGNHYDQAGVLEKRKRRRKGKRTNNKNNDNVKLSQSIDALVYLDLELSYKPTEDFTFVLGGANILDQYPNKAAEPYANLMDYGMPYPRQTVANYEGGSWYLRMVYEF